MLYAAAVGTLETGDIGEEPYRARLASIVETLRAACAQRAIFNSVANVET